MFTRSVALHNAKWNSQFLSRVLVSKTRTGVRVTLSESLQSTPRPTPSATPSPTRVADPRPAPRSTPAAQPRATPPTAPAARRPPTKGEFSADAVRAAWAQKVRLEKEFAAQQPKKSAHMTAKTSATPQKPVGKPENVDTAAKGNQNYPKMYLEIPEGMMTRDGSSIQFDPTFVAVITNMFNDWHQVQPPLTTAETEAFLQERVQARRAKEATKEAPKKEETSSVQTGEKHDALLFRLNCLAPEHLALIGLSRWPDGEIHPATFIRWKRSEKSTFEGVLKRLKAMEASVRQTEASEFMNELAERLHLPSPGGMPAEYVAEWNKQWRPRLLAALLCAERDGKNE